MLCVKCGHEIGERAVLCPYCGEKAVTGKAEEPVYQAEVKGLLKSGKLVVYRDRTEFVTSSVQKAIFNYTGLVAVRKGRESIEFIGEDGSTESCPVSRKNIHEAFLYIEQASKPYLAGRKESLLAQGVRYSFPSSQGFLNDGVLNLSAEQAEFRAKSGKDSVISFQDVKSVGVSGGTLDFWLFDGSCVSFTASRELREEVLSFVNDAIAPYLLKRKETLLERGIYFSFLGLNGGTLDVFADRVEYRDQSGQTRAVSFRDVRIASLSAGMLELALTDGSSRSYSVDEEEGREVLSFIGKAIEPYVMKRTVGYDKVFGIDERMEINEKRGVFHIIRQNGREITEEWPLEALRRCQWTEGKELSTLGSVVSGGIALFKSAAKAAGSQSATAQERISYAGVMLTVAGEGEEETLNVWFGIFPAGMSRTNKRYEQYLAEWAGLSEYLKTLCPTCELVEPAWQEPEPKVGCLEPVGEPASGAPEAPKSIESTGGEEDVGASEADPQQDELGIAKYLEGVARFIGNCATPMSIAFQGNRGSGENSTLKMLFNRMRENGEAELLWLTARQLCQGESGEALSLSVGKKLLEQFDKGSNTTELLVDLAGVLTGAIASDSSIGKGMVGRLLKRNSAGSPEQLQEWFAEIVGARIQGENGKVVLFIDGLDRLLPVKAVELLEAMRDYFYCKGCVFVVAADYNAILEGVQKQYGQGFDESRGKRFFDELFKMSFRVPSSGYDVQKYVKNRLEQMGLHAMDGAELDLYVALVQNSVGRDPESIDRLTASFQLLKDTAGEEIYGSRYRRLVLFALLCMQTRFRDAYEYTVRRKDNVTPAFLAGLCGGTLPSQGGAQVSENEEAAFRNFGCVLAQIINLDDHAEISEAECRAFAEVLVISSITSK